MTVHRQNLPERFVLLVLWILVAAMPVASGAPNEQGAKAPADDAIPVDVALVQVLPLDRTLPIIGTLLAKTEATIGAQVEGQVEKTLVDFGERVTAAQELALIDTDSYDALAKQSAANVAKARAAASNAEHNLKRVLELQKSKISSASDLDLATAQAEQARAEVNYALAADAIARLNLDRSRVKALFDGTISERIASMGDFVKVGAPLFRIVEDSELKYIVQAPERYAGQVKLGQTVVFTVDAWPGEKFEGNVNLISPSVNTATRAFNFGARVKNAGGKLKANTYARGELVLAQNVPTPVVPLDAIVNFAGVTKVFVIADGAARGREVSIGRVKNGVQEVLTGLQTGELVAVSGLGKLYDGAKVRVQTTGAPRSTSVERRDHS
jgi:membrane fusion protein (multidrug efflux system)